jgi:L-amino acid N-acyltransferase YncA
MPLSLIVDALTPADWEAVRTIYQEGVATGQASFEDDAPLWPDWDAAHHPHCRLVARHEGRVIGWAALSPISRRKVYAGVAEVSVYVAANCRGRGVGKELLQAIIEASERAGIWTLQASSFAENTASVALQQSCGFRLVGRRERIGRLNGVWRDTIFTERRSRVVGTGDGPTDAAEVSKK